MSIRAFLASFALAALTANVANATVVRVSEADFTAAAGLITFSEFSLGTVNPTYAPGDYGGGAGSPTVTFGGFFQGQMLSADPGVDCPGAAATACIVGDPTGPLSLDPTSPNTFITGDGSNPTSPVLSGTPRFNGGIAILFDTLVAGVGFDGGFFNAANSTGITAFGADGTLLGTVTNNGTGIEFLGLVLDTGEALIAGVFLDLVGAEPAGFAIDNLRFGVAGQVTVPGAEVPIPAALPLFLAGLAGLHAVGRRKKRNA